MTILLRPIMGLCAIILLGLTVPAAAQKATLSTADPQVCCTGKDAAGKPIFFLAPKSQCPKHMVVGPERCKEQPQRSVCCKTPNGYYSWSAAMCKRARGTVVQARYCRQDRKVCCKTPNGFYSWTAAMCKKAKGTVVHARYCRQQPGKICCKYPKADGSAAFGFLDPKRCKAMQGNKVNNKYCLQPNRTLKLRRN